MSTLESSWRSGLTNEAIHDLWTKSGQTQAAFAASRHWPAGAVRAAIRHAQADRRDTLTLSPLGEKIVKMVELGQEIREEIDPVNTRTLSPIRIESDRPVPILMSGCWQLGGRWTYHDFIRSRLGHMMNVAGARIGLFGDEKENFMSGSFAGMKSVYDQPIDPVVQDVLFLEYLDVIKDRTLWGMSSQHGGYWDENKKGFAPLKNAYIERGIPYFDGQAYVKVEVGHGDTWQSYNIAIAHEFPGNSMFNPVHPQRRALWQNYPNADAVLMADRHQYALMEFYAYEAEFLAGNRASPWVWLGQIGTAKGGPDPYTIRGWQRGQMEWPWLVLWPDRHEMRGSRNVDDVEAWATKSEKKPTKANGGRVARREPIAAGPSR